MITQMTEWKLNKYYPSRIQVVPINIIPKNYSSYNSGDDERFNNSSTNENDLLYNISLNYEKKQLLHILYNKNVPISTKLELIIANKYLFNCDFVKPTILQGGLCDDYYFEEF
jgi:hypothetical protein